MRDSPFMRPSRWLLAVPAVLSLLAGCSGKPSSGGLQVQVVLKPGLASTCVRVQVTPSGGGTTAESGPIQLAGKSSPLVVGVAPTGQAEPVTVQAIGYSDADCNSRTVPAEVSDAQSGRFTNPVTVLTVTLGPAAETDGGMDGGADGGMDGGTDGGTDGGMDGGSDGGVDLDQDGFSPPEDCDDTNPNIKPGVQEICADGVDNNCDSAADCQDLTACGGQACAAGGGAVCASGACVETSCGDAVDNDGDGPADCADSDCAGQSCGANSTCVGTTCVAPTETGHCADGVDNDGDLLVDCLDPDCPAGTTCSDFDQCTVGDQCGGDGGCVGGAGVMCNMPPNAVCYGASGTCAPDSGVCGYTLNLGATCDDGLGCTTSDNCDADGGCVGSPVVCNTPMNSCLSASGTCQEPAGTCRYAPLAAGTGSCSDGDNCTVNDACDGDGGCQGTAVTCTADQCQVNAGCSAGGTCQFTVAMGQPCDAGMPTAGSCNAAGTCVPAPTNVFPFTPSNFTEAQLPTKAPGLNFNCAVTLDTGASGATSLTWTGACVGTPPAFTEITIGSSKAVLVYTESLDVSSTFTVTGDRALILAVRTDATISGTIDLGSTPTRRGAGADQGCGIAAGGNGGTGTGNGGDPTGGGGGGAALGSAGGAGGAGENATAGTAGQALTGTTTLVPLRGGCKGGNGGRATATDGLGGSGGGAVQLSVAGALNVTGTGRVTAYGAGGLGGVVGANSTRIAGGGGGSGGGILLEAATVSLASGGALTANGGAGGEAAGGSTGGDGSNGSTSTATPAAAVSTGTCGGDGGDGAAGSTAATAGSTGTCSQADRSGGGGGGGVGRIVVKGSTSCTLSGVVSPVAHGNGTGNGCPAP